MYGQSVRIGGQFHFEVEGKWASYWRTIEAIYCIPSSSGQPESNRLLDDRLMGGRMSAIEIYNKNTQGLTNMKGYFYSLSGHW